MSSASTPNSKFASQAQSAEEILKEQTVGLVHLADFRKRRAEALEQSAQDESGSDGRESSVKPAVFKKKKKVAKKGILSFGDDEDDTISNDISRATTPADAPGQFDLEGAAADGNDGTTINKKKKLKANTGVAFAPKSQSKSALVRELQVKEALKKQYLQIQEAVRATDFLLPFVFFDGKDTVGGKVRMKKGDYIWLFLERARKVGAESASSTRKDWARISVDDLIFVKQDLILPPHFDFHYFILNQTQGYHGPLFSLSSEPTTATPAHILSIEEPTTTGAAPANAALPEDQDLEGYADDPALIRVVDRRWFEKNKHIYPANLWEDFDAQRDYTKGGRKDREGNQMFFSR